jgi:hypothetical protein
MRRHDTEAFLEQADERLGFPRHFAFDSTFGASFGLAFSEKFLTEMTFPSGRSARLGK